MTRIRGGMEDDFSYMANDKFPCDRCEIVIPRNETYSHHNGDWVECLCYDCFYDAENETEE